MVTVGRGDYVPQELHLHNTQGRNWSDREDFSDLGTTQIVISCEAGTEVQSEVLASICYGTLKIFRRPIMADFDIHNLSMLGISPPSYSEQIPGNPWVTLVNLRAEVQEYARMIELANRLNTLEIGSVFSDNLSQTFATLDATPPK